MNPALILRQLIVPATMVTLVLVGCDRAPRDASSASTPTITSIASTDPAPLCAKATPGAAATDGRKVMRSRGTGWTYVQHVPAAYDGATPGPLVIALGTDDPAPAAGESDAIVLAVAGPTGDRSWTGGASDERFVRDLILRAEEGLCFDERAVYLTGLGVGAQAGGAVADAIGESTVRWIGPRRTP